MVAGCVTVSKRTRRPGAAVGPPRNSLFGLLDGAFGEHSRQVLFVLGAGPKVTGRVEPVGSVLGGLFWLGAFVERLLDRLCADRCWPDVGEADPPASVHLLRGGADN